MGYASKPALRADVSLGLFEPLLPTRERLGGLMPDALRAIRFRLAVSMEDTVMDDGSYLARNGDNSYYAAQAELLPLFGKDGYECRGMTSKAEMRPDYLHKLCLDG